MNANFTSSRTMQNAAGIAVLTARYGAVLVAECTGSTSTPADAAEARRYLIENEYTDVPPQSFFLLVTSETFFLWNPGANLEALPNYFVSAAPVMRSYLGVKPGEPYRRMWRGEFRQAISYWLSDLSARRRPVDKSETDQMLAAAGVYDLMTNAIVQCDVEQR